MYILIHRYRDLNNLMKNFFLGFWASKQPDPKSGECVDFAISDDQQQSWELTTCESLLPFMCKANACPAGKVTKKKKKA